MSPFERARLWLNKVGPAISGQRGHDHTFMAARGLVWGFDLKDYEALRLMEEWNLGCRPPWSAYELNRKVAQAGTIPFDQPRGYLLNASPDISREAVDITRFKLATKPAPVAAQPVPEESKPHEEFISFLRSAFAEGEIVCICNDLTQEGKPQSAGSFLTREAWIEKFGSPDSALLKRDSMGAFVRINPFVSGDYSGADKSVSSYRHVLVEMDTHDKETQEKILRESGLPISVLIDSGGKSIHAWVRVDAADKAQWDDRRDIIYNALAAKGIDPKNRNPSRYSRLPGAFREDSRQRLIATGIGSDTFENWQQEVDLAADQSTSVSVDDLIRFEPSNDPDNLIGNRWLTKGSSMILSGGSGIGKSSLLMQLVIRWATGNEWFGIKPVKPLRIGVIQAENNTGDLAEAFQGVSKGMPNMGGEALKLLKSNLSFRSETVRTGEAFLDYARRYIVKAKLDMIIADPLLSYFGADLSNQEAVSKFLRNQLQPILKETGVCWIWIHHISKPSKDRDGEPPTLMELAYSGFGSSELTNWAREIAVIQEVGHHRPRKFRLAFCKRGGRLPSPILNIAHSDSGISWVGWNPMLYRHQKQDSPHRAGGASGRAS